MLQIENHIYTSGDTYSYYSYCSFKPKLLAWCMFYDDPMWIFKSFFKISILVILQSLKNIINMGSWSNQLLNISITNIQLIEVNYIVSRSLALRDLD